MRAFIALDLGSRVTNILEMLIDSLSERGGNIKWINPSNIHLTLKFLGEVPDEGIPQVKNGMQRAAARQPAFTFHIKGTGTFPTQSQKPRVLWVGIEAHPALRLLHQELENELFKLGFPRDKRPFSPHLTIGRVKSSTELKPVLSELEHRIESDFGTVRADRLILFESTLKPMGAEYAPQFEAGLS